MLVRSKALDAASATCWLCERRTGTHLTEFLNSHLSGQVHVGTVLT